MEQSCLQVSKPAAGKSICERNWLYLLFNVTNHGSSIPCLCSLCVSNVKPQTCRGKSNFVMVLAIGLTAGLYRASSAWLTYRPGLACLPLAAPHEAPDGAARAVDHGPGGKLAGLGFAHQPFPCGGGAACTHLSQPSEPTLSPVSILPPQGKIQHVGPAVCEPGHTKDRTNTLASSCLLFEVEKCLLNGLEVQPGFCQVVQF